MRALYFVEEVNLISIVDYLPEDFVNYKVPGMHIGFPKCSFKCDFDCGMNVCQNSSLAMAKTIEVDENALCRVYKSNPISECFILAGLEPFDTPDDLYKLLYAIRDNGIEDPVVIYTGYTEEEIAYSGNTDKLKSEFKNIIIKFGRFVPNKPHHMDDVLGVELASDNQYGKVIC